MGFRKLLPSCNAPSQQGATRSGGFRNYGARDDLAAAMGFPLLKQHYRCRPHIGRFPKMALAFLGDATNRIQPQIVGASSHRSCNTPSFSPLLYRFYSRGQSRCDAKSHIRTEVIRCDPSCTFAITVNPLTSDTMNAPLRCKPRQLSCACFLVTHTYNRPPRLKPMTNVGEARKRSSLDFETHPDLRRANRNSCAHSSFAKRIDRRPRQRLDDDIRVDHTNLLIGKRSKCCPREHNAAVSSTRHVDTEFTLEPFDLRGVALLACHLLKICRRHKSVTQIISLP